MDRRASGRGIAARAGWWRHAAVVSAGLGKCERGYKGRMTSRPTRWTTTPLPPALSSPVAGEAQLTGGDATEIVVPLINVPENLGATLGGPVNGTAIEPADPALAVGAGLFVRAGVAEEAGFPAHALPLVADEAMDLERSGMGRPVDRAPLEVVEASDPVGRPGLIGDRKAEKAARPAEGAVLQPDAAVHLKGARGRAPIDRAALVVPHTPSPVGGIHFGAARPLVDGVTKKAAGAAERGVLVVDGSHGCSLPTPTRLLN